MIKTLVAEDQALLRGAICEILRRDPEIDVVAECANGAEVLPAVRLCPPDVAVLDIEMPEIDGLEAARLLLTEFPDVRVLILTVFGKPGYLRRAIGNGALGFMLKDAPPADLINAIKRTSHRERVVDPKLAVAALERGDSPLTPRETQILDLSRKIAATTDLARALYLSEGTVRNTLSMAIQKLHAQTRAEAARIAETNGWL